MTDEEKLSLMSLIDEYACHVTGFPSVTDSLQGYEDALRIAVIELGAGFREKIKPLLKMHEAYEETHRDAKILMGKAALTAEHKIPFNVWRPMRETPPITEPTRCLLHWPESTVGTQEYMRRTHPISLGTLRPPEGEVEKLAATKAVLDDQSPTHYMLVGLPE